jgi:DNA-binding NarL/FixJ family response regulator
MKARILIVEDHPLVSDATRGLLLSYDGSHEVAVVGSSAEAIASVSAEGTHWDLILLDLDVPGAHGLSLARDLVTLGWGPKTCVVTALSRPGLINEVRDLGLLGFIPKACTLPVFSEALRSVLAGATVFLGATEIAHAPGPRLTRQQRRVLGFMAQGMSSKRIAREMQISEGTVNNHVNATLRALGASNRIQALRRAVEFALIDADTTQPPSSVVPISVKPHPS